MNDTAPGLPPEVHIIEPKIEKGRDRLRLDCPKCGGIYRDESPAALQRAFSGKDVPLGCGRCGARLIVRKSLVQVVGAVPPGVSLAKPGQP